MRGKFHRDGSNRKTYEVFDLPGEAYVATVESIVKRFALELSEPPISNFVDVIFCGFCRGEAAVQLAWDNWSGFIVTAMNSQAELLVEQIAEFMESEGNLEQDGSSDGETPLLS